LGNLVIEELKLRPRTEEQKSKSQGLEPKGTSKDQKRKTKEPVPWHIINDRDEMRD
jgi:hypothetical protein